MPAHIAELVGLAESFDLAIRLTAVERLCELAFELVPNAAAAVPQLIDALLDPDLKVGESASLALKYRVPYSFEA